jgi:hypothetical protein
MLRPGGEWKWAWASPFAVGVLKKDSPGIATSPDRIIENRSRFYTCFHPSPNFSGFQTQKRPSR